MPFAAAIPGIIQAGTSIAGMIKGATSKDPTPESQSTAGATGLQNIGNQSMNNSATQMNLANGLFNTGQANTATASNFLNTLVGGNQANTAALLQPDINRIREGGQNAIQTASTLMPRGGGRSSTLFQAPFHANAQISNLFNGARNAAAGGLAQIGQGQTSQGTNLFGIGNNALNTGASTFGSLANYGLAQQGINNGLWSQQGQGLSSGISGIVNAFKGKGGTSGQPTGYSDPGWFQGGG